MACVLLRQGVREDCKPPLPTRYTGQATMLFDNCMAVTMRVWFLLTTAATVRHGHALWAMLVRNDAKCCETLCEQMPASPLENSAASASAPSIPATMEGNADKVTGPC